jgi:hypothetical protein
MKKRFILIVAVIVLAGCQRTQWVRENTTAQQFNADKYACEVEARRMYPSTAGQPIGNPTYSTDCYGSGNNLNCTSRQNTQMRSWYDTNSYPRARMEEQCLKARGYSQQAVPSAKNHENINCSSSNLSYYQKSKCKSSANNISPTPQSYQLNRCKISDGSYRKLTPGECQRIGGSVISFD